MIKVADTTKLLLNIKNKTHMKFHQWLLTLTYSGARMLKHAEVIDKESIRMIYYKKDEPQVSGAVVHIFRHFELAFGKVVAEQTFGSKEDHNKRIGVHNKEEEYALQCANVIGRGRTVRNSIPQRHTKRASYANVTANRKEMPNEKSISKPSQVPTVSQEDEDTPTPEPPKKGLKQAKISSDDNDKKDSPNEEKNPPNDNSNMNKNNERIQKLENEMEAKLKEMSLTIEKNKNDLNAKITQTHDELTNLIETKETLFDAKFESAMKEVKDGQKDADIKADVRLKTLLAAITKEKDKTEKAPSVVETPIVSYPGVKG